MRTVAFLTLSSLIGAAMPAYCQTAPSPEKIHIDVTRAELQLIGQGLMELPYKSSAPVMSNLQAQINAIDAKAAADTKAKAEEKPADAPAQ